MKNVTKKRNTRKVLKKGYNKTKKVFSKSDYGSGDGMLTTVWGPPLWHFLHTLSFNYPTKPSLQDKINYRNFILGLKCVLPCGKCRKNFKNNLKELPLKMSNMKNRNTFSLWVYKLHELINKMLNKKSGLSYNDVRERYEHFRARCSNKSKRKTKRKNKSKNKNKSNKIKKSIKKEDGCVTPLYGKKAQCVLHIIPHNKRNKSLHIDKKCIKKFKK